MDLYKILRVRRNASAETITRAFRKRAMASHPDRGGDRTEFEQVSLAYRILSDPERRAKYDSTGDIDDSGSRNAPDGIDRQVVAILSQTFQDVLMQLGRNNAKLANEDVVGRMRAALEKENAEMVSQRPQLEAAAEILRDVAARLEIAQGDDKPAVDNLLRQIAEGQLAGVTNNLSQLNAAVGKNAQALEELKHYRYRHVAMLTEDNAVFGIGGVGSVYGYKNPSSSSFFWGSKGE